ncbi:MAG: D-alanyl-D-alanine carboxypeptidase [Lachnospiraceae bacterium]|nr:D-alanyl-D-alanine carboxypeptidase [Lachnospiraceae bacterium]
MHTLYRENKECANMKKRITLLMIVLSVLFAGMPVYAKEEPDLHARAALLMDAATGRVLYEKDGYTPYAVASTTKILTAVLVLEADCEEEYASVSANAAKQPKVKLYVKKGEKYKVKDLLYSLLLESHNDTAVVLAEHVAGSVEKFAERMNAKAAEIGCRNAYFITPNGLDADIQGKANQASAYDMALITSYALQNERFVELIRTKEHTFTDETGRRQEQVSNANRFLDIYDGAIGVKTGFTNLAGYCFVGAAETKVGKLICVVLGCGWPPKKNLKWQDSEKLMDYGANTFERVLLEIPPVTKTVKVKKGKKENISVGGERMELFVPVCEEDRISKAMFMEHLVCAPVENNKAVGWSKVYLNGEMVLGQTIFTKENCSEKRFSECLQKILHRFYI